MDRVSLCSRKRRPEYGNCRRLRSIKRGQALPVSSVSLHMVKTESECRPLPPVRPAASIHPSVAGDRYTPSVLGRKVDTAHTPIGSLIRVKVASALSNECWLITQGCSRPREIVSWKEGASDSFAPFPQRQVFRNSSRARFGRQPAPSHLRRSGRAAAFANRHPAQA
jgi:hypothetical protein